MLVLLGYSRDSLPGEYLTLADWGFLQKWHWCRACRVQFEADSKTTDANLKVLCKHTDSKVVTQRGKSFNAFMLTLSDQQLVVGPAMVIAALVQYCGISCYDFQVVMSLALLASTTHLATLVVIQQYLRENKVVRYIRAVTMIVNLVFLICVIAVITMSYSIDIFISVQYV